MTLDAGDAATAEQWSRVLQEAKVGYLAVSLRRCQDALQHAGRSTSS